MELAFLFKIPLYRLMEEMPYEEYLAWTVYLEERPPGRQEDYRAAMLLSAFSKDAPVKEIFPSLKGRAKTIGEKLKDSPFFSRLKAAQGDDVPKGFYD